MRGQVGGGGTEGCERSFLLGGGEAGGTGADDGNRFHIHFKAGQVLARHLGLVEM